jgi:hypothetical protein
MMARKTSVFETLVEQVASGSARASEVRMAARESVIERLRNIEAVVKTALAGESLKGCKNLAQAMPGGQRFQAVAISNGQFGIDTYLPFDGRPLLVWTKAGELHVACQRGRVVESRRIEDDEITAQDLEPVVRALELALIRHLEYAEESHRTYRDVLNLSSRISRALDE